MAHLPHGDAGIADGGAGPIDRDRQGDSSVLLVDIALFADGVEVFHGGMYVAVSTDTVPMEDSQAVHSGGILHNGGLFQTLNSMDGVLHDTLSLQIA